MQAAIIMPIKGRTKVDKALQQTKAKASDDIRGVYFIGLSAIIKQTPVDEGRARNNWFLTIGMPFSLTSGRGASKSGSSSFRSLQEIPEYVMNKKVYFTNNLPYIETLEYGRYPNPNKGTETAGGFSNQAQGGWVRTTLIAMQNKIKTL
tara:strand:- start:1459 stop:1905 length:447 start_codon:yes stop_codon:yes gene_type:complete